MAQLTPYLTFNGNCREAMIFYKNCFGGELTFQTVGETLSEIKCPSEAEEQIMHSMLVSDDIMIMASDMIGIAGFTLGTNIALSLTCDSVKQIKTFFINLSNDGFIADQLSERPWGALFGVIADKYGITWMLSYDENYS